jgi:hypothetical protein
MPAVLLAAQGEKEKWQRVYTGEDSIIEINVSKVTFVEYNVSRTVTFSTSIGRVGFRTTLSKSEALKETPAVKYKSRLETIEFNCVANRYRLHEATLLDEKGKIVKAFGWDPSAEWREIKHGGMMEKLSGPACKLIDEKRRNP